MNIYPLQAILLTFATANGKRRILFNAAPLGGMSNTFVLLFFISLPFIEYAILFNDKVFNYLGIATAIVFFIIFLSIVMIIVFFVSWGIKKKVIKNIKPSWDFYFPGKDLEVVLSTGRTQYVDFFTHYSTILKEDLSDEEMLKKLLQAFLTMEEDNKDLLEAMKRNKNL